MKLLSLLLSLVFLLMAPHNGVAADLCGPIFSVKKTLSTKWIQRGLRKHEASLETAVRAGNTSLELWITEKYEAVRLKKVFFEKRRMDPLTNNSRETLQRIYEQKMDFIKLSQTELELKPAELSIRLRVALTKLMDSKIFQVAMIPYLPRIRNAEISTEILSKWMIEGFDKHAQEIDAFVLKQNRIETYRNARFVWNNLVNLTFAYMLIGMMTELPEEANKLAAQIMEESSATVASDVTESLPDAQKILTAQAEESLKMMLEKFEQKYGTQPTDAEYQFLKKIAYKEYGMTADN